MNYQLFVPMRIFTRGESNFQAEVRNIPWDNDTGLDFNSEWNSFKNQLM